MLRFLGRFLDSNEKEISKLRPLITAINDHGGKIVKLKDKDFPQKTAELKHRLSSGETLDDLLIEAFALVREASVRTIKERHYDVQLMAGITLHQGKIAEQKTGEGKTLSATPALYLNALSGRGVHLVTVNDYLARRDAGWMGTIYHFLGLTTSAMIHDQSFIYDPAYEERAAQDWRLRHLRPVSRREAYAADITYGINSEYGFDYLRDNMVTESSQVVQRGCHYAIVDEVDSVLIDEARTPHIISAPDTEPTQKYYEYARLIEKLSPNQDYQIDEKLRTAHLTEHGITKVEKMLGVPNLYEKDFETIHHIEAALKSRTLFHKDKEYVVRDNQIIIVDEFTGRLLPGRRYSEGLHQAIEAKENVTIQQESRTLATVSLQNYFRMYEKLAGMTGTAATEAEEFHKIYKLDVIVIPTNRPMVRADHPDLVYKTMRAKYGAVAQAVSEAHKRGQPVLVGTASIEHNEIISDLLKHKGIPHQVLNAKQHEREAMTISEAGEKGAVTVATNMAGRGVDIILGGSAPNQYESLDKTEYDRHYKQWKKAHDEVVSFGGLFVIGTERHESRRIDNQLRGRAGRQGDPGQSRFFISLEDDLMRIFGGEQISRLMTMFNLPEDVPLEHRMVSKAIEQAQIKVESFNFDARKHLVEYDDVLNKQREIIYRRRRQALMAESLDEQSQSLKESILTMINDYIDSLVAVHQSEGFLSPDREKIVTEFSSIIPFDPASKKQLEKQLTQYASSEEIIQFLKTIAKDIYEQREKQFGKELMRQIERWVTLSVIDSYWMDHLDTIDDLREGIGLRGYGQRDPLIEYKNEAFNLFERLMKSIDGEVVNRIYKIHVQVGVPPAGQSPYATSLPTQTPLAEAAKQARANIEAEQSNIGSVGAAAQRLARSQESGGLPIMTNQPNPTPQTIVHAKKIGRNDPCWCGSGKKWKKCHYPNLG